MEDKKNYVEPPKKNKNYVAPPKKEGNTKKNSQDENSGGAKKNYVAPPKKKQQSSQNNSGKSSQRYNRKNANQNQYAGQEKSGDRSYNSEAQGRSYSNSGQNKSGGQGYNDGGQNVQKEKIKTPKMGARFYFSGYLVWMLIFVLFGVQSDFLKILLALYVIASNFTLSWYADYQRYKGGSASWFFTPFISAKTAAGLSVFMGYRTSTTKRGFLGSYKTKSSRDLGKTASTFFLVSIFIELFKLIINIPLAFVTLFTHQRTLQNYVDLVDEREG